MPKTFYVRPHQSTRLWGPMGLWDQWEALMGAAQNKLWRGPIHYYMGDFWEDLPCPVTKIIATGKDEVLIAMLFEIIADPDIEDFYEDECIDRS